MFKSLIKALNETNDPESVLIFWGVLIVSGLLFSVVASVFLYNLIALFLHHGA